MREELEKTLSLFSGSDLIFISYGKEKEGEYIPHCEAIRIEPDIRMLEDAINHTPLLPNDFGIMPFVWKARSEEEKSSILFDRKLLRWTEGELFAYGYLIIDRLLIDIDIGEMDERSAKEIAVKLRKIGIGKVGYTGGGLLAVLELDGEVKIEDRETFRRVTETLRESVGRLIPEGDEGSFNAGKGIRLIGTFSRKRNVQTKWIMWEEGKKFDACELILGINAELLSRAPVEIKESVYAKFGIKLGMKTVKKVLPEEVFKKASEFYGELDGMRNNFMLKLSGEMLSAGIEKETVSELYYEYLAHLEKRDKPLHRVKQTIEWVYKEGKTYHFSEGDCPRDFFRMIEGFRGKEVSLDWDEFAKETGPEKFIRLLRKLGHPFYEGKNGVFHRKAGLLIADLKCEWSEEDEEGKKILREEKIKVPVFLDLPPCVETALEEYEKVENGDTEWYLENLIAVSFLLPESSFHAVTDKKDFRFIDNPLAKAIAVITENKGIEEGELGIERIKRKITRKNDSVWNLVRCMNPLLKERCCEECECYRFRHTLPEVLKRRIDIITGEVEEAVLSIEGDEVKVSGKVLSSLKKFESFLEKRGYILPKISLEWLYKGIMKLPNGEYRDFKGEAFREQLSEILGETAEYFVDGYDGKNIWIGGKKFMELLTSMGISNRGSSIKKLKDEFGFKTVRTKKVRYTLIPKEFLFEEDLETVLDKLIEDTENFLSAFGIKAEVKDEITEEDKSDKEYITGKKAYIGTNEEGIFVSYAGELFVFRDPADLKRWLDTVIVKGENESREEIIDL